MASKTLDFIVGRTELWEKLFQEVCPAGKTVTSCVIVGKEFSVNDILRLQAILKSFCWIHDINYIPKSL